MALQDCLFVPKLYGVIKRNGNVELLEELMDGESLPQVVLMRADVLLEELMDGESLPQVVLMGADVLLEELMDGESLPQVVLMRAHVLLEELMDGESLPQVVLRRAHVLLEELMDGESLPQVVLRRAHVLLEELMDGESLPQVVLRRADVLFTLFVFVCYSGVQHILCCVFALFFFVLCKPMLLVSLDCTFLIALSVVSNFNSSIYIIQISIVLKYIVC